MKRTQREQRDKYLKRKYGISLEEYNKLLKKQNGRCAICKSLPKTRSLAVDHNHKFKYIKIKTLKVGNDWYARSDKPVVLCFCGDKRNEAIQALRAELKRLSVRGLLCHRCNRGLQNFRDDEFILTKAVQYINYNKWGFNI
jgi:Recombination endonuclease VII